MLSQYAGGGGVRMCHSQRHGSQHVVRTYVEASSRYKLVYVHAW